MFYIPTFEEIRDAILRDTQSLLPDADVSNDSDHFVHASRLAACAVGQYAHQAWIMRQIFPDTADTEYLERHAALRGIVRKKASHASGHAKVFGIAGAKIEADTEIKAGDLFYRTLEDASISRNGTANIAIRAEIAGSTHNTAETAATFMSTQVNVQADCTIEAMGGSEAESDRALLNRLLERIRRPPAGGNKHDYRHWALEIDGVANAYVYPLRRGLGTVDVVIVGDEGVVSKEIIEKTQSYIDEMRPVTAKNVLVSSPDQVFINVSVSVKLSNLSQDEARAKIQAALSDYFKSISPAQDLIVSQIEAVISNIEGIADRQLLEPKQNIKIDLNKGVAWHRLGDIEVRFMP